MTGSIVVHRFWYDYRPSAADASKLEAVEKVAYGPIGQGDRSVTIDAVSRLQKLQPIEGNTNNPAVLMAHARWNAIRPHYEAWKSGEELPEAGTPLSAWNAVTPEQADVFRRNGIRTVEDVAAIPDGHIVRFPLPNVRELKRQAEFFLKAAETTRVSDSLARNDEKISLLEQEKAEQAEQIRLLLAKVDQLASLVASKDEEPKRGPGRPRKDEAASVAA